MPTITQLGNTIHCSFCTLYKAFQAWPNEHRTGRRQETPYMRSVLLIYSQRLLANIAILHILLHPSAVAKATPTFVWLRDYSRTSRCCTQPKDMVLMSFQKSLVSLSLSLVGFLMDVLNPTQRSSITANEWESAIELWAQVPHRSVQSEFVSEYRWTNSVTPDQCRTQSTSGQLRPRAPPVAGYMFSTAARSRWSPSSQVRLIQKCYSETTNQISNSNKGLFFFCHSLEDTHMAASKPGSDPFPRAMSCIWEWFTGGLLHGETTVGMSWRWLSGWLREQQLVHITIMNKYQPVTVL